MTNTTAPRLTTSSLAGAFAARMRYSEDFDTSGALKGRATGWLTRGELPAVYFDSLKNADYVVYSYATPIAWRVREDTERGEWIVPDVKYSRTTSKHQSKIRAAVSLI